METINITANSVDASQIEAIKAIFKAMKIKFKLKKESESPYDPKFVEKIEKSRNQVREGKTVKISLDDIWK
jgi:hypothetical protein